MKLVKLSLAALLAAGALSSVASAKPLDEAIKNVDVSGFLRARYTTNYEDDGKAKNTESTKWNYRAILNAKVMIDDNFFAMLGFDYDASDVGHGDTDEEVNKGAANLAVDNFYLGYTAGNTTLLAGRQAVGAFWTDDMLGTGLKVLNSDVPGLTLAALWMDSLEKDGDISSSVLGYVNSADPKKVTEVSTGVTNHDLFGAAAIGSFDPVSFQVWYAKLMDVTDLMAAQVNFDFAANDDMKFGFVGQVSATKFDSDFLKGAVDDGLFFGVELNTELYGFDASVGYVDYSTEKDKVSLASFEDKGQLLVAGEQIGANYPLYAGENFYIYGTVGYTINGLVRIGVDYAQGKMSTLDLIEDNNNNNKTIEIQNKGAKVKEITPRISYKYDDALSFSSYYSMYEEKIDGDKAKSNEFRLEAKYSF